MNKLNIQLFLENGNPKQLNDQIIKCEIGTFHSIFKEIWCSIVSGRRETKIRWICWSTGMFRMGGCARWWGDPGTGIVIAWFFPRSAFKFPIVGTVIGVGTIMADSGRGDGHWKCVGRHLRIKGSSWSAWDWWHVPNMVTTVWNRTEVRFRVDHHMCWNATMGYQRGCWGICRHWDKSLEISSIHGHFRIIPVDAWFEEREEAR